MVENQMVEEITIRQPDDWHLHLRDGELMKFVLPYSARVFRRAIIMPNLDPPITNIQAAISYRQRIENSVPKELSFVPLMTAYLTDDFSPDEIEEGHHRDVFFAAKLYPANSTTNSSHGVTSLENIYPILQTMERIGMPLLIHGEVVDNNVDVFDREFVFIERHLKPLLDRFSNLRVVLEHITTKHAVDFVEECGSNVAATITPHHLHINRNSMFDGGFRSDFYCLPVAKREKHRLALRAAAVSGNPKFFLGTDSAPHTRLSKESSCGCAGIFNAPFAIESYAEVFSEEGVIERLEAFSSEFGANFYGLPLNNTKITLVKQDKLVPEFCEFSGIARNHHQKIVPFHAGELLGWSVLAFKKAC